MSTNDSTAAEKERERVSIGVGLVMKISVKDVTLVIQNLPMTMATEMFGKRLGQVQRPQDEHRQSSGPSPYDRCLFHASSD